MCRFFASTGMSSCSWCFRISNFCCNLASTLGLCDSMMFPSYERIALLKPQATVADISFENSTTPDTLHGLTIGATTSTTATSCFVLTHLKGEMCHDLSSGDANKRATRDAPCVPVYLLSLWWWRIWSTCSRDLHFHFRRTQWHVHLLMFQAWSCPAAMTHFANGNWLQCKFLTPLRSLQSSHSEVETSRRDHHVHTSIITEHQARRRTF